MIIFVIMVVLFAVSLVSTWWFYVMFGGGVAYFVRADSFLKLL